jgi:hypothetical protein
MLTVLPSSDVTKRIEQLADRPGVHKLELELLCIDGQVYALQVKSEKAEMKKGGDLPSVVQLAINSLVTQGVLMWVDSPAPNGNGVVKLREKK